LKYFNTFALLYPVVFELDAKLCKISRLFFGKNKEAEKYKLNDKKTGCGGCGGVTV